MGFRCRRAAIDREHSIEPVESIVWGLWMTGGLTEELRLVGAVSIVECRC
jgi:hypothetical protein